MRARQPQTIWRWTTRRTGSCGLAIVVCSTIVRSLYLDCVISIDEKAHLRKKIQLDIRKESSQ
ncbi:hypothetical protein KSP40_PGU006937 [Platanthera guangdongensis]|uniref:Uncharacterized protein n=1 Tax=Platanthera guangdongensis TaxID=2320717 RepID=A0ABR2MHP4_9ASPA